jgi:phosphohistidine phosphatase
MLLWIVRHGKAEPASPSGKDDDRPLAPRGRRQADWLGTQILSRADRPRAIISSPVRRAIDTARLVNASLAVPLETSRALEVGRPASTAVSLFQDHDAPGPLMLVGHNPQLEKLVGLLTRGQGAESGMSTGQAVLLDVEPDSPIGAAERLADLRLADG